MSKTKSGFPAWLKFGFRELDITRKTKPPLEQWEDAIAGMDQQMDSAPFWRGDLFNQGCEWYGDTAATSVFDPLKSNVKTWINNGSVCNRVEASRRRESLSYSHHAEVAYLDPEDQDKFLQLAIDEGLSVRKLREQIRKHQKDKGKDVSFRVGPIHQRLTKLANKAEGMLEELAGDSHALVLTGIESFKEAAEIEEHGQRELAA